MKRKEIEDAYDVVNGIIKSPGKFEGQLSYVPYFWEISLEGCGDFDNNTYIVEVEPNDREMWPELGNKKCVRFLETEDGFVEEV